MKTNDINVGTNGEWSPKRNKNFDGVQPHYAINGHSTLLGKVNPSTKRRLKQQTQGGLA